MTILATPGRWPGVAALALVAVAMVPVSAAASGQAATPAHGQCGVMFPRSFVSELPREFPGQREKASVYDTGSHRSYHLHRTMRITTASVIKAQVLGAVCCRRRTATPA